jgi:hypothetical protein
LASYKDSNTGAEKNARDSFFAWCADQHPFRREKDVTQAQLSQLLAPHHLKKNKFKISTTATINKKQTSFSRAFS